MLIVSQDGLRVVNTETMDDIYIEQYDEDMFKIYTSNSPFHIYEHESEEGAKRMLRKITDAYAANERVFSLQEENK